MVSTKILSSRTVFNIDKKCFLCTKSAQVILKDHDHTENVALPSQKVLYFSFLYAQYHNNTA